MRTTNLHAARLEDVHRFYFILGLLEDKIGGRRFLAECSKASGWPRRGVYFFMEPGEQRSDSGSGLRIVRVGTHSTKRGGSRTTLWNRLSQHRSGRVGGSIFRNLIGRALFGKGVVAARNSESNISEVIRQMPFLWLNVDVPEDVTAGVRLRKYVERNAIALLSSFGKDAIDPPSGNWLGNYCTDAKGNLNKRVIRSGLWNQQHVDPKRSRYDPNFLDRFNNLVTKRSS